MVSTYHYTSSKDTQRTCHCESLKDVDLSNVFSNDVIHEDLHACQLSVDCLEDIVSRIDPQKYLQETNGIITWARLARFIAGGEGQIRPVSSETIRKHIMSSLDFR